MTTARVLHRGALTVSEYRCTRGPHDRPFSEQHAAFLVAYVRAGCFGYHYRNRCFDLAAGSVLLGYPGDEYTCTHEHGCGDECLVFSLAPDLAETIGAGVAMWRGGCLPPAPQSVVYGELAQAAADCRSAIGLDEAGLMFASQCLALIAAPRRVVAQPTAAARGRVLETALWLDAHADEQIDLVQASAMAGFSPFHFLRLFAAVLGVTPHQYLVQARLRRAARLLAQDLHPVTEIAFDVGFSDLSNFVRTFHRAAGLSPRQFRRAARRDRKIVQEWLSAHGLG